MITKLYIFSILYGDVTKKAHAEREKFKHKPGIATSAQQEREKKAKE